MSSEHFKKPKNAKIKMALSARVVLTELVACAESLDAFIRMWRVMGRLASQREGWES